MKLREITLDDYKSVCAVQKRNGISNKTFSEWKHLLVGHPFVGQLDGVSIGWVLENDKGEIVGSNTNVPMLYEFNGKFLRVANASSWVVDENYRGYSIKLGMAWVNQKNVDLLLDISAIEPVAKLLVARKFLPLPASWYTRSLLWILDYPVFTGSVFRKKQIETPFYINYILGTLIRSTDYIFGKNRTPSMSNRFDIDETTVFDKNFDDLWEKLRKTKNRLLLCRDAKSLTWRHKSLKEKGKLCIITAFQNGILKGYAILWEYSRDHLGLRGFQVADLQAENDDPMCIETLILHSLQAARSRGMHVLEATGFNQIKRKILEQLNPHKLPGYLMPYYYRVANPELAMLLGNESCWDPTISDGF